MRINPIVSHQRFTGVYKQPPPNMPPKQADFSYEQEPYWVDGPHEKLWQEAQRLPSAAGYGRVIEAIKQRLAGIANGTADEITEDTSIDSFILGDRQRSFADFREALRDLEPPSERWDP